MDLTPLQSRLCEHEGVIPHLYLDTMGYCTCGIGHLVISPAEAQKLPWIDPTGEPPTNDDISEEFWRIHGQEKGHVAEYYERFCRLRLTDAAMREQLGKDILANSPAPFLPGFDTFPEPAKEALLDMSFQLGAAGLIKEFPHMIAAVKARDWNTCAQQCWRQGIQAWRNEDTEELFKKAAGVSA